MERPKNTKPKIFDSSYMTHFLDVKGEVNYPLHLTADEARSMKLTEVKDLTMICGSGRNEGFIQSYRGILLTDLLNRADVMMREHNSPSHLYVTVMSSDDHWVLFSYQELYNSSIGEQAIVILEKDGHPLGEEEGEFAFVSANDTRLGARKLRYLKSIEVHEHRWNQGAQ
jgi:hypothetical protein